MSRPATPYECAVEIREALINQTGEIRNSLEGIADAVCAGVEDRDLFAGLALLASLLALHTPSGGRGLVKLDDLALRSLSCDCWRIADAMIDARPALDEPNTDAERNGDGTH